MYNEKGTGISSIRLIVFRSPLKILSYTCILDYSKQCVYVGVVSDVHFVVIKK